MALSPATSVAGPDRLTVSQQQPDETYVDVTATVEQVAAAVVEVMTITGVAGGVPVASVPIAANGFVEWGDNLARITQSTGALLVSIGGINAARFASGGIFPPTADTAALGSAPLPWSDAFFGSGAVVNFGNSDVTATHATGSLTIGIGGSSRVRFAAAAFSPAVSGSNALGTTELPWSDVCLASGGVLDWANGNVSLTHSSGTLTMSGALSGANISGSSATSSAGGSSRTMAQWFANVSGGIGTAAGYNTGTSGATVPLLDGANTWSATQTLTGGFIQGTSTWPSTINIRQQTAVGVRSQFVIYKGSGQRWGLIGDSDAETGFNSGSSFNVGAYNGSTFLGYLWEARRASGPMGTGRPYFATMRPYRQNSPRFAAPGGFSGNEQIFGASTDVQPTFTLGSNPLSVQSGSPTVTITWVGACVAKGIISTDDETWVLISGATATGGITPSGWLEVQTIVDDDHFTVTWTSNASSTTTGGGSSVTIQPSFEVGVNKTYSTSTTGATGFPIQWTNMYEINPLFFQIGKKGPNYQQFYNAFVTPNETSGTKHYISLGMEWDFINRGIDPGYKPIIHLAKNATVGMWMVPVSYLLPFVTGGGSAHNWNTMITIGNAIPVAGNITGTYVGFSSQPNALVGQDMDPTGHGGVFTDAIGSYVPFTSNPFATTIGTSTITVTSSYAQGHANGESFYLPASYTLSGVTFGAGSYVVANATDTSFTITGSGTAAASIIGGGSGQYGWWENLVPYAPHQITGTWAEGFITNNAHFESGAAFTIQPPYKFRWKNSTAEASIAGVGTGADIDVVVLPAGSGQLDISGTAATTAGTPASFSANRRLQIKVNGTSYYLPLATVSW